MGETISEALPDGLDYLSLDWRQIDSAESEVALFSPAPTNVCLGVMSRHDGASDECLLCPRERTSGSIAAISESAKFGGGRASFYHLIRAQQERFRDRQAECLCGLEVDDQLEFGWLLDRELARARASEDPVGQRSAALVVLLVAGPVKHQATVPDLRRKRNGVGRWYLSASSATLPVSEHHVVGHEDAGLCFSLVWHRRTPAPGPPVL